MIHSLLNKTMSEDCLEVLITEFGNITMNVSIGFIRQGSNFIQTHHGGMQWLGEYGDVIVLKFD